MNKVIVISPVKNAIDLTLETAGAILSSKFEGSIHYYIYNDNSTPENTARLDAESEKMGFGLIHIKDLTDHPSPNYTLVLQEAQKKALAGQCPLLIVESDVVVKEDTIQKMFNVSLDSTLNAGLIAAVTVDEEEKINYPYLFAKKRKPGMYKEKKHLSFCCTLFTVDFLKAYDFANLNPDKNWHDVTISHIAKEKGFTNYLLTDATVLHRPHSSRPWKLLKYKNPIKYYWIKWTKGLDKI